MSSSFADTPTAMCMLDTGADLPDVAGSIASDILVVVDPRNPAPYEAFLRLSLHSAYTAVVVTRNPALHLPSQRHALLAVSLVRGITQLCEPAFQTPLHIANTLRLLFTLRSYLNINQKTRCACLSRCAVEPHDGSHSFDHRCIAQLLEPTPGRYLTEASDDVQSICRILAALCCLPEHVQKCGLFEPQNASVLGDACLALLGETVSRDVRVKIRSINDSRPDHDVSMTLLQSTLGITEDSCAAPANGAPADPSSVKQPDNFNMDIAKVKLL